MNRTTPRLITAILTLNLMVTPGVAHAQRKGVTVSDVYVDDIDTEDLTKAAQKALDRRLKSSNSTAEFKALAEKKENHAYLLATSREDVIFNRIRELGATKFTTLCDPEEKSTLSSCLNEILHEISDRYSLTTTGLAIASTLSVIYGTEMKSRVKKSSLAESEKKKQLDQLDVEIAESQIAILKAIIKQDPKMIVVTKPDTLKTETDLREKIKAQLIRFLKEKISESKAIENSSVPKDLKDLTSVQN